MLYIHPTFLLSADDKDNEALHQAGPSLATASSCFALINAFASEITNSELQANERMHIWDTLLQTLKDSHTFDDQTR